MVREKLAVGSNRTDKLKESVVSRLLFFFTLASCKALSFAYCVVPSGMPCTPCASCHEINLDKKNKCQM
jgi:hypothetical protein